MSKKRSLEEVHESISVQQKKGWRRTLAFLGPAYLISVGYMDPGNWATDLAAGSQFGYRLLWVLLLSNLIALLLQSLSARIGIVRGLDLAQATKNSYPNWVNIPLFSLAQIAIIACDLAEIIGMAIGLNLLFGLPLIWGVSITILDTILLMFLMDKGMRKMEAFIVSMVFIVGVSFLAEMFIIKPQVTEIIQGLKPSHLSGSALYIAIGIIGATVMPHNLYLHSSLVQTRKFERSKAGIKEAIKFNLVDTSVALNLAFFVNAAILILAAAAFYKNGFHQVAEIQDAHELLKGIFGNIAPTLFAIALIAAGQSSTVTGTLAGQIVMEGHLNLRIQAWLRRLITRLLAIIPAFLTIIYFGEIGLGKLLILSQVVLSLQLGFAVIPLIHFNSNKKEMKEFTIKLWVKILAWLAALLIIILNFKLVVEEVGIWLKASNHWAVYVFVFPALIFIVFLLFYILIYPIFHQKSGKNNLPHGQAIEISKVEPIVYQRIAIALDFSKKDIPTLQHALLQGGNNATYYLIHVVETAAASYHGKSVYDYETQSDTDNLNKYRENLQNLGYQSTIHIGFGKTAKAIAQTCKENKVELLVMGAHGHRGFKDLIFGTTVGSVRHKLNIPVLIVS